MNVCDKLAGIGRYASNVHNIFGRDIDGGQILSRDRFACGVPSSIFKIRIGVIPECNRVIVTDSE